MAKVTLIGKTPAQPQGYFLYSFESKTKQAAIRRLRVYAKRVREAQKIASLQFQGKQMAARRTKPRRINSAIKDFHLGENITIICTCGVDYGDDENGGGGNCAHYAANKDIWNITNQDGIKHCCPSGFATLAADLKSYCDAHSAIWTSQDNADAMKGQGLIFGEAKGRIVHVGVFDAKDAIYHYGFSKKMVLKNKSDWWVKTYDNLYYYQKS